MPKDTGKKLADMLYGQPFDVPTPENLRLGQQMIERELREKAARDAKLTPLDKAKAAYEAAKMMGSAAVAGLGSIPTRIVYGPEAAEKYIANRISIPTTEKGLDYVENVGNFLEQLETKYKLPPILPEAIALQHLTGPATKQAIRQGAANLSAPRKLSPQAGAVVIPGKFKAPQDEAMRVAQQRAALPVEQGGLGLPPDNTPEMRAKAMGFDTDTYHGSFRDITKFDPSVGSTESHAGRGIYSTDSPEDASLNYASIYGPDVSGRVERAMEDLDKDWRKTHSRMRDEVLTPRQQEIILQNTINADNLGVVYPLKVRSNKSIHLDAPEANPVRIGPFESYDEAADAYVDTPHTAKFNEALDEFRELGGEANPVYEVVQDYGGPVPARDVFNVVKKTGDKYGLYDPFTGEIVSGGVAAGDFVKHFGIDEIRHTPQFRNQQLNIGGEHVISLDPDNVRSRFAAFDPFRKDVATAAAMGALAPDLLAKEKDEDKNKDKKTKKASGGSVHISDNPDVMQLELAGGGLVKGLVKAVKGAKSEAQAAEKINRGPAFGAYGYTDDALRRERGSFASNFGVDYGQALTPSFEFVPVSKLKTTEKVADARVNSLMNAMKESGNTLDNKIPPVVVDSNGNVLDGHHRIEAARRLGYEEVPVIEKFDRQIGPKFGEEYAGGGLVKGLVKAVKGTQEVLPAAEREANLAKMLEQSKVKDRLYHATPKSFKQFKPGGEDPTMSGPAIWLSTDPKHQPAMHNISAGKAGEFREGVNVMPVHVQAKNPLVLDDPVMIDWAQTVFSGGSREFPELIAPKWAEEIRKEGYDSIIFADPRGTGQTHEVIMFEPEKIKSAIGNRGTYDVTDPDINKAEGGEVHMAGGGALSKLAKTAQQAKKASEVLGEFEGHPLLITQSDRTKVGGKWLGGPGFSGLQHTVPEYKQAEAAWGVAQPATAKTILGGYKQAKERFGKEPLVTAMIGTPTQHQSNKMVFEELHRMFTKSAKEGNLDLDLLGLINDRLRNAVNKEGKNIFPEDVSILDKNFRKVADTFDKRAVASSVMGGTGVGGKKGQIIDYDAVIRHTTDPLLLDAPTGALGNRAFTLSGGLIDRPDLHPAFPSILQGEDIGQLFAPVPRELVMRDFIEKTMREKGRTPGFMDYTRGYPPTQLLTEDILTELQKKGYAQGGAVSYAEGGEITADDLILEERKL